MVRKALEPASVLINRLLQEVPLASKPPKVVVICLAHLQKSMRQATAAEAQKSPECFQLVQHIAKSKFGLCRLSLKEMHLLSLAFALDGYRISASLLEKSAEQGFLNTF